MSVVTLRIDAAKHARLKQLAASRNTSVNRLLDELATVALVQHDMKNQFRAAAKAGNPARGLALLKKLEPSSALGFSLSFCVATTSATGNSLSFQAFCGRIVAGASWKIRSGTSPLVSAEIVF